MKNYYHVSPSHDGWTNLATDEWILDNIEDDELFLFFYVNKNAVILGKNQNPWKECNMDAMNQDGVQLVRRITGGGAVYHDCGNLNFSFIAGKNRYDVDKQLGMILQALRALGIPCECSGRNDMLCQGKKFSGNAFCSRKGARQHHGTLLIHSDLSKLQNYLNVDARKLEAKGVTSVRSRVCNLTDFSMTLSVPIMISSLRQAFRKTYGDYTEWMPQGLALAEIQTYREKHASFDWRIGQTPRFDIEFDTRFPWGGAQLLLTLLDGKVSAVELFTDALDNQLPNTVRDLLQGCPFEKVQLVDALYVSENEQIRDIASFIAMEHF
ncbi:MAG: lipoate--protein ligase [Eubacteriales bacterium]